MKQTYEQQTPEHPIKTLEKELEEMQLKADFLKRFSK